MEKLSKAQLSILATVAEEQHLGWYGSSKPVDFLMEHDYITDSGMEQALAGRTRYAVTEKGAAYIERLRSALEENRLSDLRAEEKRTIIDEAMFEEPLRHKLLFDTTASVQQAALDRIVLTEDDYLKLSDDPRSDVRAKVLASRPYGCEVRGISDDVIKKFSTYTDSTTICAVISYLRLARRTDLLDEGAIGTWLSETDTPADVIDALNGISFSIPDANISRICTAGDPEVAASLTNSKSSIDRLTSEQIDMLIDLGNWHVNNNIATGAEGLTVEQVKKLLQYKGYAATAMRERLIMCANALTLFADGSDPQVRELLSPYVGKTEYDDFRD